MDTFTYTEKYGIVYNEFLSLSFPPSKFQGKSQILYHYAHFYLYEHILNLVSLLKLGTLPTSLPTKCSFPYTMTTFPLANCPGSCLTTFYSSLFVFTSPILLQANLTHPISRIFLKRLSFFPYLPLWLKPTWLLAWTIIQPLSGLCLYLFPPP